MKHASIWPLAALPLVAWLAPAERVVAPLEPTRDLATLVPADAVVFVESPTIAQIARAGFDHPVVAAVLAAEPLREMLSRSELEQALAQIDDAVGAPVLDALASLCAEGAALALVPRADGPKALAIARGASAQEVERRVDETLAALGAKFGAPHGFERPHRRHLEADVWNVGDQLTVARRGAVTVIANDGEVVDDALELAARAEARGLLESSSFEACAASRDRSAIAWAFVDLDALESLARASSDAGVGYRKLRELAREPSAQFLLGPCLSSIGGARGASLALSSRGEDLVLRLDAHGVDDGKGLAPRDDGPAPAAVAIDGATVHALAYRDLAAIVGRREDLFEPRALPPFAEALANLQIFFGGVDVERELLPALSPWIELVVDDVAFEPSVRPRIDVPAAAAILRLRNASEIGPALNAALSSVIAIANVERGQQGKRPFALGLELVDGVAITSAKLPKPGDGEGVDAIYNLEPACAIVGDAAILGTHRAIVERCVRELARSSGTPRAAVETWTARGRDVAAALDRNVDALAMQAMLDEGKTLERALADLRGLVAAVALVERATLRARFASADAIAVELEIDLPRAKE